VPEQEQQAINRIRRERARKLIDNIKKSSFSLISIYYIKNYYNLIIFYIIKALRESENFAIKYLEQI